MSTPFRAGTWPVIALVCVLAPVCLYAQTTQPAVRIETIAIHNTPADAAAGPEKPAGRAMPVAELAASARELLEAFDVALRSAADDQTVSAAMQRNRDAVIGTAGLRNLSRSFDAALARSETIIDPAEREAVQAQIQLARDVSMFRPTAFQLGQGETPDKLFSGISGYAPGQFEQLAAKLPDEPIVQVELARRAFGPSSQVSLGVNERGQEFKTTSREASQKAYDHAAALCKTYPEVPEAHLHAMHLSMNMSDWKQARRHALDALRNLGNHHPATFRGNAGWKIATALALQTFVAKDSELADELDGLLINGVPASIAGHDALLVAEIQERLKAGRQDIRRVFPH